MNLMAFMRIVAPMLFAALMLGSCIKARPLEEEKSGGLFTGASGEWVVYQDGTRGKRK